MYVPYARNPVSANSSIITPSFLRSLYRCESVFYYRPAPEFLLVFCPRAEWLLEGEGLHIHITGLFESFPQRLFTGRNTAGNLQSIFQEKGIPDEWIVFFQRTIVTL
jgi:hypothetical protein